MRISSVQNKVSFGRELRPSEIKEFEAASVQAKQLTGQTGMSIFIVHDPCLPREKSMDTGLGNLATKEAQEFFKYMKPYLGFNTVEVLPQGEVAPFKGAYCAYAGSALSLGNHQINPLLLTTQQFENILKQEEYNEIVEANNADKLEPWHANYNNVMKDGSPQDKALRAAYERFKNLSADSKLKKEFAGYVGKNNDWLEPKGIFKVLFREYKTHKYNEWENETDRNLYNPDYDLEKRKARIADLIKNNEDDIDYTERIFNKINIENKEQFDDFVDNFSSEQTRASITFEYKPLNEPKAIIELFENADKSSFLHEMAHLFLQDIINASKTNDEAKRELDRINDFLGHTQGEYTRQEHEKLVGWV